jgi:hypothetical protein
MNYPEIKFEGFATVAVWFVFLLGLVVVALSLYCCFFGFPGKMDQAMFDSVVSRTLVPMYTSTIAAVLAWVFGKHLVAAIAARIARGGSLQD